MLDINPKPPTKPIVDTAMPVIPAQPSAESISKKGVMVILSADALKLSRDLQAVVNDPDKEPTARLDASVQLRQMAAQILTAK